MAMPSSEALWSEKVLEFSLGQSINLMKHLNEPEENEESGRFSYYFQYVEGASE